jgi:hypothetical protein
MCVSPHLVVTMLPAAFGSTDPLRRYGRQIPAARQTRAVAPEF